MRKFFRQTRCDISLCERVRIRELYWSLAFFIDFLTESVYLLGTKGIYVEGIDKYLRVILLSDGVTVHNAFFDRSFQE